MNDITPDRELTQEELELVARLSEEQLAEIDAMLLSHVHAKYNRKVAYLVGATMRDLPSKVQGIPDVFYSQRVARLVEQDKLVAESNLSYMRYSEVRLPQNVAFGRYNVTPFVIQQFVAAHKGV